MTRGQWTRWPATQDRKAPPTRPPAPCPESCHSLCTGAASPPSAVVSQSWRHTSRQWTVKYARRCQPVGGPLGPDVCPAGHLHHGQQRAGTRRMSLPPAAPESQGTHPPQVHGNVCITFPFLLRDCALLSAEAQAVPSIWAT